MSTIAGYVDEMVDVVPLKDQPLPPSDLRAISTARRIRRDVALTRYLGSQIGEELFAFAIEIRSEPISDVVDSLVEVLRCMQATSEQPRTAGRSHG